MGMIPYKTYEKAVCGIKLICDVILMGRDATLILRDNKSAHIGCTVLAIARPSLTGKGISATTSVINCIGHKDDVIARRFAEAAAIKTEATAVCTCGIHIDSLTENQIQLVLETCEELLLMVLEDMAID
ncbi:MAG: hypothetical protein Q4D16_11755 [Eubacteriales bacterium]|nr:hypothetical protein [Eubacteriales bacterium]